ncbi:hypothetical protein GTS_50180 [Gandjariella thermophila]|uniref:Uncharacterized protein n=1 Tax=Gandjariella thermophila TaxID=1931992 RepID=A0A4D4J983_9PSEU|nr:hypothetical protein GTS_50180 [Gandjariella thermophila]
MPAVGGSTPDMHAPRPHTDAERWGQLRVLLAAPPLPEPVPYPTDDDSLWDARAAITFAVAEVAEHADALSVWLPRDVEPPPGSWAAVASSAVRIARAFARDFADARQVTPARVAEYNRTVELLRHALGEPAPPSARPDPRRSPRDPAGALTGGRRRDAGAGAFG